MDIHILRYLPGDKTEGRHVVDAAVSTFPEMLWQSTPGQAIERIITSIEENERVEIVARAEDGRAVGFACVVHDEDDHVGPCLGVQWNFVLPEARGYAGIRMWREIRKLAADLSYDVLAYTHRTGPAAYLIRYTRLRPRRVHGQEGKKRL